MLVPGIEGPDLTARALAALREAGWSRGPVRIEVEKLIPVAAGLGGGSADAAAVLRLARGAVPEERLEAIARTLGADVSSQLDPGFALVGGAGEEIEPLPAPHPFAAVLIPDPEGLSTAAVYAEADRLGSTRSGERLAEARRRVLARRGRRCAPARVLVAARQRPGAGRALAAAVDRAALELLHEVGAPASFVTGSGPTAVGLFPGRDEAVGAATELRAAGHEALVASSVEGI